MNKYLNKFIDKCKIMMGLLIFKKTYVKDWLVINKSVIIDYCYDLIGYRDKIYILILKIFFFYFFFKLCFDFVKLCLNILIKYYFIFIDYLFEKILLEYKSIDATIEKRSGFKYFLITSSYNIFRVIFKVLRFYRDRERIKLYIADFNLKVVYYYFFNKIIYFIVNLLDEIFLKRKPLKFIAKIFRLIFSVVNFIIIFFPFLYSCLQYVLVKFIFEFCDYMVLYYTSFKFIKLRFRGTIFFNYMLSKTNIPPAFLDLEDMEYLFIRILIYYFFRYLEIYFFDYLKLYFYYFLKFFGIIYKHFRYWVYIYILFFSFVFELVTRRMYEEYNY